LVRDALSRLAGAGDDENGGVGCLCAWLEFDAPNTRRSMAEGLDGMSDRLEGDAG
jgi:hypothetical protein